MRRAARTDDNQSEIVDALRKAGAFVTCSHAAGGGFPDLTVIFRGRIVLMEVKDGAKPPSAQKLTPDQTEWHAIARAAGVVIPIVRNPEEALQALDLWVTP